MSEVLTGFTYIYLLAFFALLAGLFHPLINNNSFGEVIGGVFVLFLGLIGGILLYKTATSESNRVVFLVIGLALMTASLLLVFQLTGRA